MHFAQLIETKRDGYPLPAGEWTTAISEYLGDRIPDYQMAALLMAVVWRGLEPTELDELTRAMLESGDRLPAADPRHPRVDKHSTGGVGDKTSLVLAPLVASWGVQVPMMSGRGLGHTGGTTDKLEAIPGFRTTLSLEEVEAQLNRIGVAMFGQTERIVPADRRLYALRDVTGTVPSIPLIAASIMSKKLAEGLSGLVLDVKTGSGAFMTEAAQALELARTMVGIGEAHGCRTTALVTAMDRPLGRAIGNALEVEEALLALEGQGPADLLQLTGALGVEMLRLGGVAETAGEAERLVADGLMSGGARRKFADLIAAQGGNPNIVDDPGGLPQALEVELFEAPTSGIVQSIDPRVLGQALIEMGGGRRRIGDTIDHSVGFVVSARPGATVQKDEPIASVFAADPAGIEAGLTALRLAIRIGPVVAGLPLILHRVTREGVEQVKR